MLGAVYVKSELEVGAKYVDILLIPREKTEEIKMIPKLRSYSVVTTKDKLIKKEV